MKIEDKIKSIKSFILDMDGTIYLGNELFDFTKDFLSKVQKIGRNYYFFTNNSSKSQEAYIEELANMGICIQPKQMMACHYVRNGCTYYGINPDWNCPIEGGNFIPDCGSMAKMIEASTGHLPEFFGKPSKHTLDYIIEETGYLPEEIAIVGDRLYTDIAVADGSPVTSILVLTGESTREDTKKSTIKPNFMIDSLKELTNIL